MNFEGLVEHIMERDETTYEEAYDIVRELRYQIADCEGEMPKIATVLQEFGLEPEMVSIDF